MSAGTTKERILDAAEEIMLQKSFHSVGLNEILSAVKVPKGSFYHYFESKEQFGVELLQHYVNEHSARLRSLFSSSEVPALERFSTSWEMMIGKLLENQCRGSCLVAKLASEVANFSEPMRTVLKAGLKEWRSIYTQAIEEGQHDGSIRKGLNAEATGILVQDLWQGAMHRMQVEQSVAPLKSAVNFLRDYLAAR